MRATNSCLYLIFSLLLLIKGAGFGQDYNRQREQLATHLAAQGIKSERVLQALNKVERHLFVPDEFKAKAYDDVPLPIGEGQTISQPYVVAFMTEALELSGDEKVLEIGTGSGYQAAILSELCQAVFTIEIIGALAVQSAALLKKLKIENVFVRQGDGYLGWPEEAPFDAIIVTCSPSHIPRPLEDQLKEGGRLIVPVGTAYTQELVLLKKKNGKVKKENRLPVIFVPMKNKKGVRY